MELKEEPEDRPNILINEDGEIFGVKVKEESEVEIFDDAARDEQGEKVSEPQINFGENFRQQIVRKEVKIVLRDFRKDFPDIEKRKSEEEFFESSAPRS